MRKNDLLEKDGSIIRVLHIQEEKALVIDCLKPKMPKWMNLTDFTSFGNISEEELLNQTGKPQTEEELTAKQKETANKRFGMIAPILPFISNEGIRAQMILELAEDNHITPQTFRLFLSLYLAYQSKTILAPKQQIERKMTEAEKNIRWALNKYYYTPYRNTLTFAYTQMLKEKYTDSNGILLSNYPSIFQFRYYYQTHKKIQTQIIAREGKSAYYRNHRPLLGNGVTDYCPTVGYGMLDSTLLDIYLRDEQGKVAGRPILTLCVDGFSSMVLAYCITWEGGVLSLQSLLQNQIENKVEHCRQNGIEIQKDDWNVDSLCSTYITDRGAEYLSYQIEQLTELGITVKNLAAFHPNDKSRVEQCFNLIQNAFRPYLNGKGSVQKEDYWEITGRDYKKESCLTLDSFRKIVLNCILYYNSKRILSDFPFTEKMLSDHVEPFANKIYNWGLTQSRENMVKVSASQLILTMLPRTSGTFTRNGLIVNKLRYRALGYAEQFLHGGKVVVAYSPADISRVWVVEHGAFSKFELIESRYHSKTLEETKKLQDKQKELIASAGPIQLQAKIDLANEIETIINTAQITQRKAKNNG